MTITRRSGFKSKTGLEEVMEESVHIELNGFSCEQYLTHVAEQYSFFNGNSIQKELFTVLVNSFLSEEPTKLGYLSKRFEYVFNRYLSENSNQKFLSGRIKESLLIDVHDILFKSNQVSFLEFVSKNSQISSILDMTLENIQVLLNTYSTKLTVHQSSVESFKFNVNLNPTRVLPTSDQFSDFMNSFNQGKDFQQVSDRDNDFCATPKYHVYLGKSCYFEEINFKKNFLDAFK
jgi:hypothetical protein